MTDDVAATRRAYDDGVERYVEGIGTEIGRATETPFDQGFLTRFAEHVAHHELPLVADLGCGPGRAAAFVAAAARVEVLGLDVSLGSLRAGRAAHPGIPFAQGELARLPLRTATLGGVVSWYSIIHTPPAGLARICDELVRVLAPGGSALIGFQAGGGESVRRKMTSYRHAPDEVALRLEAAGLEVVERAVRPAELDHETTPQAFTWARRAPVGSGTTR